MIIKLLLLYCKLNVNKSYNFMVNNFIYFVVILQLKKQLSLNKNYQIEKKN